MALPHPGLLPEGEGARITASAPGKLVLLGEYAVLEGAPALVLAVNRRARVALATGGDGYVVDAPALGIAAAECRLNAAGRVEWSVDGKAAARLGLAAAVIEAEAAGGAPPGFRAVLDTDDFFLGRGDARAKLGLGSSAALTVALGAALRAASGRGAPPADTLIQTHRRLQGGHGSGLDIAASLHGGLIAYRLGEAGPEVAPLAWPAGLVWRCLWSGKSASTGDFLRRVAAWRERERSRYDVLMTELGAIAASGAAAVRRDDAAALLDAVREYAGRLARLGTASGADIVCREHRAIASLAADCGIAYKSCGAGGGDIGIALATDAGTLAEFERRIARAGFRTVDLALDPRGLAVDTTERSGG